MIFEIHAERTKDDKKVFFYDNQTNQLRDESGVEYKYTQMPEQPKFRRHTGFSKDKPLKKSRLITTLKIQLGLSCNYSCDYCSQKFVERAPETSKKDIDAFMEMMESLEFSEQLGLKIEFWGGEPLVYWKTLKPLVDAIEKRFAHWRKLPEFSMITNGSILTEEICDWLIVKGFSVGISHDGPGQPARGPDPFDDPKQKDIILGFYRRMRKDNRISFNAMLNAKNQSRKAVYDWFVDLTGDPDVPLGEGSFVDAYDADGVSSSLQTLDDHFKFRRQAFTDIYASNGQIGFGGQLEKVNNFIKQVLSQFSAEHLGQKCGMDNENVLAVDLRGNVMTCQNVSHLEPAKNGELHHGGNIQNMDAVELKTSTHWSNRVECPSCPVLQVCKGSCMYLEGDLWKVSCDNAYSDNVALFALGFAKITGYIPFLIKQEALPEYRQDIFGTVYQHQDKPRKKIIPIKVFTEKVGTIDNVEVYGKSRVAV
jgi:uncharacterized protein